MSTVDMTAKQATASLTGWDLQAIKKQTHTAFTDLEGLDIARALAWIIGNRDGRKMTWNEAMDLTIDDLNDYFAREESDDPKETPN